MSMSFTAIDYIERIVEKWKILEYVNQWKQPVVIFYIYCNSHYDNNCLLLLLIKLKDSCIIINIIVFYIVAKGMLKNKRKNTLSV